MKIVVTGANGYIGSKVVTKLLNLNHKVIAIDFQKNHIDSRAKIILGDIFDSSQNWYEYFEQPDVCLHLAWKNGFVHNSTEHILNLSNHFYFLKNLIDAGISQIAVMGTMHEAGYFEGKMNELKETNPQTLYGIAKDCLRRSLELYVSDKQVKFQWLRAFYIYGDDEFGNSIFCKIRKAKKEGKKLFPFTSGKNKYDFLSIDELVNQIAYAVSQTEILGEINVCSGIAVSLKEQVEKYISDNNLDIKLDYGKFPDRPYDSPCIYGDNTKIRKIKEKRKCVK